jgi:hypothetical protein
MVTTEERWILLRQEFYYWVSLFVAASFPQDSEQSLFLNLSNRKLHCSSARSSNQPLFQIAQAAFFVLADQIAI